MSLLPDFFLINNALDSIYVIIRGIFCITSLTCGLSQLLCSFLSLEEHLLLVLGNIHHHLIYICISELYIVSGLLASSALRLLCHYLTLWNACSKTIILLGEPAEGVRF